jgi:DNA-binding YbaB/EbfC family protein
VNPLKMQEMLEQARHMQDQMQEKLSQTVVEGSSGGGAVTVRMNGQKQVLQLKIDAAAVMSLSSSPADVEMLEDLVTAGRLESPSWTSLVRSRHCLNLQNRWRG